MPCTLAVNVTDCPKVDGFSVEVTVAVVGSGSTVTTMPFEVEAECVASPEYPTVTVAVPTGKNPDCGGQVLLPYCRLAFSMQKTVVPL